MKKKNFIMPNILLSTSGGAGTVIGGGSGQGGLVVTTEPVGYEEWAADPELAFDHVGNDGINFTDYVVWWSGMMLIAPEVFSQLAWENLNEGYSWDEWFGD